MKNISVLVTAGGTIEDIDNVRGITNHASGRLGSLIADEFARGGDRVTYLCGESALRPAIAPCETIVIRGTSQLANELERLLREQPFDCVIHTMAVSDFTPVGAVGMDELALAIEDALLSCTSRGVGEAVCAALQTVKAQPAQTKISSKSGGLVLILEQTPKVIRRIKELQPATLLVGFKLLSHSREEDLLAAAGGLMADCGCDYVLANDLRDISGERHAAMLMDRAGNLQHGGTKAEIARLIYESVTAKIGRQK